MRLRAVASRRPITRGTRHRAGGGGGATVVSRTKMSVAWFVSPETRFVASDWYATRVPSELIAGRRLSPSDSSPEFPTLSRVAAPLWES